jgi:hypothetical protein
MSESPRIVFACSCESTMPIDGDAIARGCGGDVRQADQLCRAQIGLFRTALASGRPITVGCTQEAPLFAEAAAEVAAESRVAFANVREAAGWSDQAGRAGPKMAALLAAAAEPVAAIAQVPFVSQGVTLV